MINEQLESIIEDALKSLNLVTSSIKVSTSARPDLCDYQCNDLFKIAKTNNLNIEQLGHSLVTKLKKTANYDDYFSEIEFVRPGFLNITISSTLINNTIKAMVNQGHFGIKQASPIETFVIDYGGPNVAKPLHVGHMRTAIVGESIKRIINYKGHKTIGDIHLGDYGLQIGQVIYGILSEEKTIDDINISYLDYIYPKMSTLCKESEEIKEKCAEITKKLQEKDPTYTLFWKKIMEVSCADMKKNYDFLNVNFDYWYGESDAYNYLERTKTILESKKLLKEDDGALIVDVKLPTDNKEIPPFIFQKSNGAYLYESTDLATILQRKQDFNPDHILYVVDNRQELHFERVFRTSALSEIMSKDKLEFLGYGTVNGEDGKPYKTRSGKTPKLEGLFSEVRDIFINKKETNKDMSALDIDKIVNSILKFADLQNSRDRDYVFDISKFSDVVGKTGPYILYTYLRLNKITNNQSININCLTNNIYNNFDRQLRLKMLELPLVYEKAFSNRMPHFIADYLYELCVLTNSFYQQNHVNSENNVIKVNDWLNIIRVTENIIKTMLNLLGIEIPTKM